MFKGTASMLVCTVLTDASEKDYALVYVHVEV